MISVFLRKLLDLLLFSNVFIACCAVAQAGLTYLVLAIPVDGIVLSILGCATLALYNFSMVLAKPTHPQQSPYRRVRWIFKHERFLWAWTGVALAVTFSLMWKLHFHSFLLLTVLGIMGLAYNLPLLRSVGTSGSGLRQIPGLKVFYIGLVWAISCVLLPVTEAYHNGLQVTWPTVLEVVCWVFLFVVAITIPFDVRDIYQDKYYGLKTIPVILGERKALALSGSLLFMHGVWVMLSGYAWGVRVGLATGSLVALLVILFPPIKKDEYYYFLLIDGLMLLQFLIVYLCVSV